MADPKDISFTSMVCSKILHDIAGPIGAIMNGAELLAETGDGDDQEEIIDLIKSSADQMSSQVKAFRIAFGALSSGWGEIGVMDFRHALESYSGFRGFSVRWTTEGETIHKDLAKLILNTAFILGDVVRKKGELHIIRTGDVHDYSFAIEAFGEGIVLPDEQKGILEGTEAPPHSTSNMSAYIVRTIAESLGVTISIDVSANAIVVNGLP